MAVTTAWEAPHVLVVAGADSSGGAGLVRDIETVAAHGLKACLAVTAVTVQTHTQAHQVQLVDPQLVDAQMRAALKANTVAAIKIGMLGSAATANRVAKVLADHPNTPAVLDPVIAASSGRALLTHDGIAAVRDLLMPQCHLVTPNMAELLALASGVPPESDAGTHAVSRRLAERAGTALLLKGGHRCDQHAVDWLFRPGARPRPFTALRRQGTMRGTGCVLASAIAAGLARGAALDDSIDAAKAFLLDRWPAA